MGEQNRFADAIADASQYDDFNVADPDAEWSPDDDALPAGSQPKGGRPQNERDAQAEANAAFAELAKSLSDKHGVAVIWQKPRIARKRTSAEYKFWRKPVMAFIESPEMLDVGPTDLARRYAPTEPNFTVTKDTFRAPLSEPARKAAGKLLKSRGYNLKLPTNFSVRDVQRAMKDQRDRAKGVATFKPVIEIVGNTVYCDGKSFEMQPAGAKKRIRVGNGWLSVERLIAFLSGQTQSN